MKRTSINPSSWNVQLGFDQAELVEGHRRELLASGQDAVDDNGKVVHPDDMAGQLRYSLDKLEELLTRAEMTFANVVRLNFFTTDMEGLLQNFALVNDRFKDGEERFATSLLGVTSLAAPGLVVMMEATAMD